MTEETGFSAANKTTPLLDVLIVGAGLSGIGAAYHLQHECPKKTFAVLEGRASMGGTWDLFKYPGIRSDSDMYTLGFPFSPWENPKAIADGPSILKYIKDTAAKFGIDKKIQFNHKVVDAAWSDTEKLWTLQIAAHENVPQGPLQCKFLFMCSGYYNYDKGYAPQFPGSESFKGAIIHPQKWDAQINYENKKVVIIGSGATAVTLVPEMAKKAEKVTMLQRSPTYIISLPSEDAVAKILRKILPRKAAYDLVRWKNILFALGFYNASRKWPHAVKKLIQKGIKKELGAKYNINHFNPKYKPWDQRLCIVPDADLFHSIKEGKAEVVTDTISHFTPKGILLNSGKELEADIIVTATGLNVQLLGGMTMRMNDKLIESGKLHSYRGVMFSDVPNFAIAIGYTNASWTLKCDLNCRFVTRLLNNMEQHNYSVCTPRFDSKAFQSEPLLDFNAGYVLRAADVLPKQGSKHPWKVYQNYVRDLLSLKFGTVNDKYLEYQ
ncbi:MAG: NAD(P)/FAD-dependent oxidoreductase [Chitinophagales bacterium]|nr:NAD(P)/FAD-dependent oxidoreductase [Chitinophagales bacterium]